MISRKQWMLDNNKRISRGAWERRNRAYDVHRSALKRAPDGSLVPKFTWVLMQSTTKYFRKCLLSHGRKRFTAETKVGEHR